jgi:hypothetical protein
MANENRTIRALIRAGAEPRTVFPLIRLALTKGIGRNTITMKQLLRYGFPLDEAAAHLRESMRQGHGLDRGRGDFTSDNR